MRKQLLAVFLPLLVVGLMVAADTESTGTSTIAQAASQHASLQRLDVVRGTDGVSIEITAAGQVTPKLSTLDAPARVVLDLPNTVAVTNQRQSEGSPCWYGRPDTANDSRRLGSGQSRRIPIGVERRQADVKASPRRNGQGCNASTQTSCKIRQRQAPGSDEQACRTEGSADCVSKTVQCQ